MAQYGTYDSYDHVKMQPCPIKAAKHLLDSLDTFT